MDVAIEGLMHGGKDTMIGLEGHGMVEQESEMDLSMTCVELENQGISHQHLDMLKKKHVVVVGSGLTRLA